MKIKMLSNGFSLPVLGQGTWRLGGDARRDPDNDDAADIAAIRRGIEAGLTHIDTAEMYAEGHAEELVGAAIAGMNRDTLFLTTKIWKNHLSYDGVLRAAEGSLRRLGTGRIDLYLIHQVDPAMDLAGTLRAMNRLRGEGVIGSIGVSNFSVERLRQAQELSDAPIAANQVHYNLQVREAEASGVLDYCLEHHVMAIAWRPLRGVDLAAPVVLELAGKYGVAPGQIALSFLTSQPGVVAIAKASSPAHLAANVAAAELELVPSDIERLRREYPGCRMVSEAVPLI